MSERARRSCISEGRVICGIRVEAWALMLGDVGLWDVANDLMSIWVGYEMPWSWFLWPDDM